MTSHLRIQHNTPTSPPASLLSSPPSPPSRTLQRLRQLTLRGAVYILLAPHNHLGLAPNGTPGRISLPLALASLYTPRHIGRALAATSFDPSCTDTRSTVLRPSVKLPRGFDCGVEGPHAPLPPDACETSDTHVLPPSTSTGRL